MQVTHQVVHSQWPGYDPVVRRIKTCDKEVTLQELMPLVCEAFNKWATSKDMRHSFNPHKGYALGVDVAPDNVSITELVHRGGSDWQLELWIPGRHAHRPAYS